MTTIETRRLEMFERVLNFGTKHRDRFPENTVVGRAFAAVAEAVAQLTVHDRSKMSATGAGRGGRAKARAALVAQLEAIAQTALLIARTIPDFGDPFRMPRRRQADQTLLTAGGMFLQDAEVHKSVFIAHKMPATFVEDLKVAIDTLRQSIVSRTTRDEDQTEARAGIDEAFEKALEAVSALDILVLNEFRQDVTVLAVWERDRRIDYPRRVRRVAATEPVEGVEPAAPPAAVAPSPEPAQPAKAGEPDADLKVAS